MTLSSSLYQLALKIASKSAHEQLEEFFKQRNWEILDVYQSGTQGIAVKAKTEWGNPVLVKLTSSRIELNCVKAIFANEVSSIHLPKVYYLEEIQIPIDGYSIIGFYVREHLKRALIGPRKAESIARKIYRDTKGKFYPDDDIPENFGEREDFTIVYMDPSCVLNRSREELGLAPDY